MAEFGLELLEGEKVDLVVEAGEEASTMDPETRYVEGEVRIVTDQARYPLSAVPALLDSGDYKLNPDFQRRHRWDVAAKSKLVESFIMNVPIPPIFLYEDEFGHYEVMDGLQRLTAISDFYANKFALTDLAEWSQLDRCHRLSFRHEVRPCRGRRQSRWRSAYPSRG